MEGNLIKKIFIITTGYVPSYKEVLYVFDNRTYSSWLSSRALLEFLFPDPNLVDVIIVHPDNEDSRKAVEEGVLEQDYGLLKEDRPAIKEIFSKCRSVSVVRVSDSQYISETDLLSSFDDLDRKIQEIAEGDRVEITYDLTHSYRHLAFVILLQSIYLQALSKGKLRIKDIFYAFAKQPLKEGAEVRYLNLTKLFQGVLNTHIIKDAVVEMRPFPLRRYAAELSQLSHFLRKLKLSTTYTDAVKKKIEFIANKLFDLQSGFFEIGDLVELDQNLTLDVQPEHPWDLFSSKFVETLCNEIKELLQTFKDGETFLPRYRIMHKMAIIVMEKQDNMGKAFAFLRECIVEFIHTNLQIPVLDADRLYSASCRRSTDASVDSDLKKIFGSWSEISSRRNKLQHLAMGWKKEQIKSFQKSFPKLYKKLDELFKSEEKYKLVVEYLKQLSQSLPTSEESSTL